MDAAVVVAGIGVVAACNPGETVGIVVEQVLGDHNAVVEMEAALDIAVLAERIQTAGGQALAAHSEMRTGDLQELADSQDSRGRKS